MRYLLPIFEESTWSCPGDGRPEGDGRPGGRWETPLASWFRLFSLSEENEFEPIVERNVSPIDDNRQVERWEWYLFKSKGN